MTTRRPLEFRSLDDVMPEVDRLLASGYRRAGTWSLGQICRHLAVSLVGSTRRRSASGGETLPDAETQARREAARLELLGEGVMAEGVPLPLPALDPPADVEDAEEVEGLRRALGLYAGFPGTPGPHPLLGPLSREDWDRFHAVHCAHHLRFLSPEGPPR